MTKATPKIEREARLRWVPLADTQVNPLAQRELNQARVDRMAADFDLEQIGTPTVNLRDGHYFIVDGQHRIAALIQMGWEDQQIQCWVYENLPSEIEAEMFLKLNDTLRVQAMPKFRAAVHAGRADECDIDRIVRANGMVISERAVSDRPNITAVGTLQRIYRRSDGETLGRTLRIVRDAFGESGMEAVTLDGIALLCQRYNGELDDQLAVDRLGATPAGVSGLLSSAERMRAKFGGQKAHSVAAAAVEQINKRRGGKKLDSWWKADA